VSATIPDEACRLLPNYLWGKPVKDGYPPDAIEAARQLLAECLPSLRRTWIADAAADLEQMAAKYETDAFAEQSRAQYLEWRDAPPLAVDAAERGKEQCKGFAVSLRALAKKWRGEQS
jgi:hypothetical protein